MKDFLHSMHGRVFLLLIAGTITSVAVTFFLTHSYQEEIIARDRAQRVAGTLSGLVQALDNAAPKERTYILRTMRGVGIQLSMDNQDAAQLESDKILLEALRDRVGRGRHLYASRPGTVPCRSPLVSAIKGSSICQAVGFTLLDGTPMQLVIHAPPPVPPRPLRPVLYGLLLFVASIALLAWVVARMSTRPLQHLANAADRLDLARAPELLPEQGSSEVRSAARAFNRMQERIQDDLRERTGMLAAITHDLQTPLTRLRLRLEKVQDTELRDRLVRDMNAMQQMLQEGLEFARSRDSSESLQRLDLDSLLDSLCADARESGQPVHYAEHGPAAVMARPLALRRAITNVIDNAIKYGGNAEVALTCLASRCQVRISDNGPGIPPEHLDAVLMPFYRVEHSRSRETGGTGLGLSIARNIIERHNGELRLANRPGGGLDVLIMLPLAGSV